MSDPIRQALRITAEWWNLVDRVEPTDEVHNYNHHSHVLVMQANADILVYARTLTDDQIARLRPMLSKLALALSAEQVRRTALTDCERQICGPTGSHDATCAGTWHEEGADAAASAPMVE